MGGYVMGFEFGAELIGLLGVAGLGCSEAWWTHPSPPVQRGRIYGNNSEHSRCPYCHERFEEAADDHEVALPEATLSCSTCKVVHHAVCWEGHGGCSVYGCGDAARPAGARRVRAPAG